MANLQSGAVPEITIGSGVLEVDTASGVGGEGTFSGKLSRRRSGKILFDSMFAAELELPWVGRVHIKGTMIGQADTETLAFRFVVEGAAQP